MNQIFQKIDIFFFAILAIAAALISDYYIAEMSTGFYYSLRVAVLLIAMIRWGKNAVFAILISSVGAYLLQGMNVLEILVYGVFADLFLIIPILFFKKKEIKIEKNPFTLAGFVCLSYISLSLGKGIAILLLTSEITGVIDFFGASLFSMCIDILVLVLLSRVSGLVCDMNNLLLEKGKINGEAN